jgi:hypothetical protein
VFLVPVRMFSEDNAMLAQDMNGRCCRYRAHAEMVARRRGPWPARCGP